MLTYTFSYYTAELLIFLKLVELFLVLTQCWAFSNLKTLPKFTLSSYIAEKPHLETLLTYTLSHYIAELFLLL